MRKGKRNRLKTLRNVIARTGIRRAPSVEAVQPEVRTDMLITVTPSDNLPDRRKRLEEGEILGVYIVEWGFDVPRGQWAAFHRWLVKKERELAASVPNGVEYKGTYLTVFGAAHRADGRYSTFWALDSLEAISNFGTKGSRKFLKLLNEFQSFRDPDSESGFSQLYQIAAGTPTY